MIKKIISTTLCTLLVLGLSACDEESLLSENNPNQLPSETFYQTQRQAEAAVNAVYANLQTIGLFVRRYYFVYDLLSNEAEGMGSLEPDLNEFNNYTVSPGNPTLTELWNSLNRGVQRANLVIENVPGVPEEELSEELRARYLAEARFLRAWHLYELVAGWGEVPLVTYVPTQEDVAAGFPKASQDEIYQVIFDDLEFAENNLPLKSEYGSADLGRATREAAAALKGKAYLLRGSTLDNPSDFEAAEAEFEKFTTGEYAGMYRLVDNYFDNFMEETENNDESIFEVQFSPTGSANWSQDGSSVFEETFRGQEYGMTSWRNVIPSQQLVEEYEDGDPRRDMNFYFPCDTFNNGQNTVYTPNDCPHPDPDEDPTVPDDLPSWRKYQNYYKVETEPFANSGINFRVIRYAEVLLSLADAKIELGKLGEATALINEVRARPSVDLPQYSDFGSQEEALQALYHEVVSEFAGEQVFWKFQKRRPELPNMGLAAWADGAEYRGSGGDPSFRLPRHLRLPFPQSEIDGNNALTTDDQNPGYN